VFQEDFLYRLQFVLYLEKTMYFSMHTYNDITSCEVGQELIEVNDILF
jgi:hypothetical protein